MVDAVQVLKPGWRALDPSGDIYSGAVLHFFDAGTSNTRTVYSDYNLSASLGTTVTCDSGGFPTSDGNTKVEVYTGNTRYKVTLKNSAGTTIWTLDNIIGALDTSTFVTSSSLTPSFPITNSSSNQTPGLADKAKYYNLDCSGGDVTVTIDNAATVLDGWSIRVRHDGTANQVVIVGTDSETFKISGRAGVTQFALASRGQEVWITSDATAFKVAEVCPPLFNTTGVILIADRLSTPPGSPQAGARYIVGPSPTGAWSGFSEHDIAEYTGAGWFAITPPTNCGWPAYVQDEDRPYQFKASAWVAQASEPATQAEQETATDTEKPITPGTQHFHPGHPKLWVNFNGTGTVAIRDDYNVSSLTDNNTGNYTVNAAITFSSADNAAIATAGNPGAGFSAQQYIATDAINTTSASVLTSDDTSASAVAEDSPQVSVTVFGDI